MASASQRNGAASKVLYICGDLGTTKTSWNIRFGTPGEAPDPSSQFEIRLGEMTAETNSAMAFVENSNGTWDLVWGQELEMELQQKNIAPEDVIHQLKLSLYKDHKTSPIYKRIEAQIKGIKIQGDQVDAQDVLRLWFHGVLTNIIAQLPDMLGTAQYSAETIAAMPKILFLSVPELWDAPENRIMTQAVKETDLIDTIQLVYEGRASTAYFLGTIHPDALGLRAGDEVIVADAGGGTTDANRMRMANGSQHRATTELEQTAEPVSGLCGSEFVDHNFLAWVPKGMADRQQDYQTIIAQLGLTQENFLAQLKNQFSEEKKSFRSATKVNARMHVESNGNKNTVLPSWYIDVTPEKMKDFFDPVIKENMALITNLIRPSVKMILVPGGFGKSPYFMEHLKSTFPNLVKDVTKTVSGSPLSVSSGVAMRYHDIIPLPPIEKDTYGIVQTEMFSEKKHPDAICKGGEHLSESVRNRSRRAVPGEVNTDIVKTYEGRRGRWVEGRWATILAPGRVDGTRTVRWQSLDIEKDETQIELQLLWSKSEAVRDHISLYDYGTDGAERPDIHKWGKPIVASVHMLRALPFPVEVVDGRKVYEVKMRVIVSVEGPNIGYRWEVAKPHVRGLPRGDLPVGDYVLLAEEKLVDGTCSPYPRK